MLYRSTNDTLVTRQQLGQLAVPAPSGPHHNPIGFDVLPDLVERSLNRIGYEITSEEYIVNGGDKDKSEGPQRFFGLMSVAPLTGEYISAKDWELQIGLRGSHDMRLPRALTVGSSVMVCSNLCFHGDLGSLSTKQTTNIMERLPNLVQGAIELLPETARRNQQRFDAYRGFDLKPRWGDAALVEMHRRNALSGAQLVRAIDEWDAPSFEAHAEDGYTAWRLFNAATQALKPTGTQANMNTVHERSERVSSFLDEVVGL